MNRKQKVTYSFIAAVIVTTGEIIYRKVGGHSAGGGYSDPHAWHDLANKTPNFIVIFIVTFIALLIYELLGKNKVDVICPKCSECFATQDFENAICKKCDSKVEKLEGYYERHPELKKIT